MKYLRIFLWLVASHSFCVGFGLMLIPPDCLGIFGFEGYQGNFFKIQAGIFHLIMVTAYITAAIDPVKYRIMVLFSILAKFTATAFLLSFTLFGDMVWMVLVSGLADFLMGLILLTYYRGIPSPLTK